VDFPQLDLVDLSFDLGGQLPDLAAWGQDTLATSRHMEVQAHSPQVWI
jgi:hypothetical protein